MTRALEEAAIPESPVRIISVLSGLALDVEDGSQDDLAAIIQSADPDNPHQHWRIVRVGDGEFRIENESSGSVLDAKDESKDDGAPIVQLRWHGREDQRWRIIPVTDGEYRIENVNSEKPFDVKASSKKDKTAIVQHTWHDGENQKWRIVPVEEPVGTGTVMTWGQNYYSQLGTGPGADKGTPAQVMLGQATPLDRVKMLAPSSFHSLALLGDSTVRAWGNNARGCLGDGSDVTKDEPVAVLARPGGEQLRRVKSVATGGYYAWGHSLALLEDSTVRAWGYGGYGQLGNGEYNNQFTPVPVKYGDGTELSGVKAIAGPMTEYNSWEGMFSLALMADTTVRSWGYNYYRSLGDGSTDTRPTPVTVLADNGKPLTRVKAIAAGAHHCLALLEDGTVRAWGYNDYGQLGNGNTTPQDKAVPVTVGEKGEPLTGVKAVAAGGRFSFALLKDGTVRAWGRNDYGQLGDGSKETQTRPVVVRMSKDGEPFIKAKAIAGGAWHGLALLEDGTMRAWGYGPQGQLGDGHYVDRATPVLVRLAKEGDPLTGVVGIAAGAFHSMAIRGATLSVSPGVPPDATLTRSGEVCYPGVRLDAEGAVAAQTVHVDLPQGKGLQFVAEGSPGYQLTVQTQATLKHCPGNLTPDGQTLTFHNVDLGLPANGATSRAWVAVKATRDTQLGDTFLTFRIGDRTSPSTPIHVVDRATP